MERGDDSSDSHRLYPLPFGPYTIRGALGKGGVARVFLAQRGKDTVALKFLQDTEDKGWLRRFQIEDFALRRMSQHPHENVIQFYDSGRVNGMPYIAMEYVEGVTLEGLLRRGVSYDELYTAGVQVARGLGAIHEANLVHRDIKPSNIQIENMTKRAVIMDFGCAMALDGELSGATLRENLDSVGTALFMPYEHFAQPVAFEKAPPIDHRADFYSLGMTLLLGICGDKSLLGFSNDVMVNYREKQKLPPIIRQGVLEKDYEEDTPEWMHILREQQELFTKLCHPDAAMRFPHARAVERALRHAAQRVNNLQEILHQTRGFLLAHPERTFDPNWARDLVQKLDYDAWAAACTIRFGPYVWSSEADYQSLTSGSCLQSYGRTSLLPRGYRLDSGGTISIGRSDTNIHQYDTVGVSRRHAELTVSATGFILRDLGSRNGTYVNDERLTLEEKKRLIAGDRVRFGSEKCRFIGWSQELYDSIRLPHGDETRYIPTSEFTPALGGDTPKLTSSDSRH
ncbi:protein kinase [Candidatus Woesearchaeota archaeon]|nr:protein kinase [Candidatus Woesearchaeota archaeon]